MASQRVDVEVGGRALSLSNLAKVLYPQAGTTKGEVVSYYSQIAPAMLPHLAGRAVTFKRYPNGVEADAFFEKRVPPHAPDWIPRMPQADMVQPGIDGLPALVWAANLAALELHVHLHRAEAQDEPDSVVFDLDPGPPADAVACARVALLLREVLAGIGLEAFVKSSGSKGLQAYVPLHSGATYAKTKPFAKAVAELLARHEPDLVVASMAKALRPGKVFVDWSQNDPAKTTVCAYSLRARPAPTASTPLAWDELERAVQAGDPGLLSFEAHAVLGRVEAQGDLFAPVAGLRQALPD